jgi:hypothetical protein
VKIYGHVRSGNHFLARLVQARFFPDMAPTVLPPQCATGHWSRRLDPATFSLDGEPSRVIPYADLFGHHLHPSAGVAPQAVYIYRDGRAVARSVYRWTKMRHPDQERLSLDDWCRRPLDWSGHPGIRGNSETIFHNWKAHLDAWHCSGALLVCYEDLVDDPEDVLGMIRRYFSLTDHGGAVDPTLPVGWNASSMPDPFAWKRELSGETFDLYNRIVGKHWGRCDY